MQLARRPSNLGGIMRRQNTFTKGEIPTGKHFLVCCDGSDLSLRGVLLAAYLMGERDRIKVITVDMPAPPPPDTVEESVAVGMVGKRTANEVLTDARLILTKCGVLQSRVEVEELDLEEETSGGADTLAAVAKTIVRQANALLRRTPGMLVLGATDVKTAQTGKAGKAVSLGPVALQVLKEARCTVAFCKDLDVIPLSLGHLQKRDALHVMVCVDENRVSRAAFDAALKFCQPGDQLSVVHAHDPGASQTAKERSEKVTETYWSGEVAKCQESREQLAISWNLVSKTPSIVESLLNFAAAGTVQLIVMGSVELMKVSKDSVVLGSVAQQIAKRSTAHVCVVKNFSQDAFGFAKVQA